MQLPPAPPTYKLHLNPIYTQVRQTEEPSSWPVAEGKWGRWSLAKGSSLISQCVAHKNISLIVCDLYTARLDNVVSPAIVSNKHNADDLLL